MDVSLRLFVRLLRFVALICLISILYTTFFDVDYKMLCDMEGARGQFNLDNLNLNFQIALDSTFLKVELTV